MITDFPASKRLRQNKRLFVSQISAFKKFVAATLFGAQKGSAHFMLKVLMTGGGTGGHVNPAIAIADTIKRRSPDAEIAFVGTSRGIENKLVPKAGYPLHHVEIQGLRRKLTLSNLKTAYLTITSVSKAKKLLKAFQPDLVVGTGGYVSFPVIKAASTMGIPTALHESNAVPGMTVKLLERHLDLLFVNFEESKQYLKYPDKALRVGNPLRSAIHINTNAKETLGIAHKYRDFLLSCGGSMGAEPINLCMLQLMKKYISRHPEILHVHASGSLEYEATKKLFEEEGLERFSNIRLCEYIYDMPLQMAAADLMINRAGSITLSELALTKKPCILIPSPYVTNNHQYKNAKVLADKGAAILIEEKDLDADVLAQKLDDLFSHREKLHELSRRIGQTAVPDANDRIYDALMELLSKK